MIKIAETLSANKKHACYSINGEWGVGKSFILDQFENNLRKYGTSNSILSKYIVFHYDCWKYDYYGEPLIALVSVLLDQIDTQQSLIHPESKERIKAVLKAIGINLWGKTQSIIRDKTGIDLSEISEIITSSDKDTENSIAKMHRFDTYFDFKDTLQKLSETISELSNDQTVILVVDELDRCLPEYTIKILERLHHVFDEIKNVQVILSVDKKQLENTVQQIYGSNVSVNHYLAKFIDFEINLDAGELQDIVKDGFPLYYNSFYFGRTTADYTASVYQDLLKGIDIRSCKAIISKSYLCHRLLNSDDNQLDSIFICIELFLTFLKHFGLEASIAKDRFDISNLFDDNQVLPGAQYIFNSQNKLSFGLVEINAHYRDGMDGYPYFKSVDYSSTCEYTYVYTFNIWGILLGCYRIILGFSDDYWRRDHNPFGIDTPSYEKDDLAEYVLKYWGLLSSIN